MNRSHHTSHNHHGLLQQLVPVAQSNLRLVSAGLVLAILLALLTQAPPLIHQFLADKVFEMTSSEGAGSGGGRILIEAATLLVIVGILTTAAELGLRQIGERLKVETERRLSNAGAEHLISLDVMSAGSTREERARQVQKVERGAEGVAKIAKTLCADLGPMVIGAAMSIWVMLAVNVWIGMIALATVPFYVVLAIVQGSRQAGVRGAIKEAREQKFASLQTVTSLLEIVQSYVRQSYEVRRHEERSVLLAERENRHHLVNHICDSLKLGIDQLGGTVVLLTTGYFVLSGELPVSAIVLYLGLYRNVSAPIRDLHRVYTEYQEALVLSSGLFEVLNLESRIVSPSNALRGIASSEGGRQLLIEGVSFGYGEHAVLHDVRIELQPGRITALVGASGAGKSTIATLIPRFYDPQRGRILMDGVDLRDLDVDWLRREVGFVGQHNHITSGTVRENVLYGCPSATETEVIQALQRAGLFHELQQKQEILETPVDHLSGGQKQRVALARVFLKNPSVLVLDEPTASLDAANVEIIAKALEELCRDRTVLVIAHDPAMFIGAHTIYVLKNGRVVEEGSHDDLRGANGEYARIIQANIDSRRLRELVGVTLPDVEQVA